MIHPVLERRKCALTTTLIQSKVTICAFAFDGLALIGVLASQRHTISLLVLRVADSRPGPSDRLERRPSGRSTFCGTLDKHHG
jgi:hypothetical protein